MYLINETSRELEWQREGHNRLTLAIREDGSGSDCSITVERKRTEDTDEFFLSAQYLDLRVIGSPFRVVLPSQSHEHLTGAYEGLPFIFSAPFYGDYGNETITKVADRHGEVRGGRQSAALSFGGENGSRSMSADFAYSDYTNGNSSSTGAIDAIEGRTITEPGSFAVDAQGNFLLSFPHYDTFVSQPLGADSAAGITGPVPVGVY